MISFSEQAKLLGSLLQNPSNKKCADCGSATPTWASLDFGVFVCSNCSGAHRALGPTVTRIKSTTLDQWNRDWLGNMVLGNSDINTFWEADSASAALKKPKVGAPLEHYNRYVVEKYIRKRFVSDKNAEHPLLAYKSGKFASFQNESSKGEAKPSIVVQAEQLKPPVQVSSKKPKSTGFNLLDDDEEVAENSYSDGGKVVHNTHQTYTAHNQPDIKISSHEDDEFDDFVEPTPPKPANHSTQVDPSALSFDELFKNPKPQPAVQPPIYSHFPQHLAPTHSNHHMSPQLGMAINRQHSHGLAPQHSHSLGPQHSHSLGPQHSHGLGQWGNLAHNPYVGYAPQLHLQGYQHSYSPQPGGKASQFPQYSNFTLN